MSLQEEKKYCRFGGGGNSKRKKPFSKRTLLRLCDAQHSQSQFIEKVFKKAENSEQNVVLLLFLFTLDQRTLL